MRWPATRIQTHKYGPEIFSVRIMANRAIGSQSHKMLSGLIVCIVFVRGTPWNSFQGISL